MALVKESVPPHILTLVVGGKMEKLPVEVFFQSVFLVAVKFIELMEFPQNEHGSGYPQLSGLLPYLQCWFLFNQ